MQCAVAQKCGSLADRIKTQSSMMFGYWTQSPCHGSQFVSGDFLYACWCPSLSYEQGQNCSHLLCGIAGICTCCTALRTAVWCTLQSGIRSFCLADMGTPPTRKAKRQRALPQVLIGSMIYCTSTQRGALSFVCHASLDTLEHVLEHKMESRHRFESACIFQIGGTASESWRHSA